MTDEATAKSTENYERLKALLAELFQLDRPDLDFGIYRVMHAKSAEVTQFLDHDLLPQVEAAFALYEDADKGELEKELAKVIAGVEAADMNPEDSSRVQELRAQIAQDSVDVGALESEVYDHLFRFFRRYYSEGDFLAKRVYKKGVYAIPYEGEEISLYWANKDQYYIKTSEYLRDYAFRLRPDNATDPMRVHFALTDAAEGEHGNSKAAEGRDRVFILADPGESGSNLMAEEERDGSKELVVRFEYRAPTLADWPGEEREGKKKPPAQKDLILFATRRILGVDDPSFTSWIAELEKPHVLTGGEKAGYTRLEAHLRRYTARNTFDYFIHKELGSFLRRELDFFNKNEIMHLDDIEGGTAPRVEQYLSKIAVVRTIAGKIIDFLAQLEDFQKTLWLKKKFVVETQYCVTLDRISSEFFPEIAANDAQRDEWVGLFGIDTLPGYSSPLTPDFLEANRNLVLDTRFFDSGFKDRLISTIDDLDAFVDGTLVHSDNFQALRLLNARFHEQIKCVYIDPPYNTASSAIPYKNDYKHSSFASMMYDRLGLLQRALSSDGAIFVSIDKTERTVLEHVLDETFGIENRVEELIWSMNTNNSQAPNYSTNHEYVLVYAKNRAVAEQDRDMFREPKPGYIEVMELVATLNADYPPVATIEQELSKLYQQHKTEFRAESEAKGLEWKSERRNDPWKGLYNYARAEYRDDQGRLVPEAEAADREARIWVWQEGDASMPATKQAASTGDPEDPNYRFYRPPHPLTGKPSPHPKSGWKFAYDDDEDSPDKRSFVSLDRDDRIAWGPDETRVPRLKRMLHEVETNVGKSVFSDYSDGEKETSAMFGRSGVFLAPKHSNFVARFILHAAKSDSVILDCFGGSGSTAQAVINLNRADGGTRKYVLIEAANYFDSVLKPRIVKAVYSPDWRNGKPLSRQGVSHCIRVVRLESYEDTLNNLDLRRSDAQQNLLDAEQARQNGGLSEQYMLHYMLNVETRNSLSLLNVEAFDDATAYRLKVKRPGSDESRELPIDLIETFNWLIGLTVDHVSLPESVAAVLERDDEGQLNVQGSLEADEAGPWWFRSVRGTLPDGRRALVIWRKLTEVPEEDNLVLSEWFSQRRSEAPDLTFDIVYVNGDSNLETLKTSGETWTVRLLDEEFRRLMFDRE